MESKKEIDALLPEKYKFLTLFFSFDTRPEIIIDGIREHKLNYPLIIKPDIGMQGKAVVKVNNGYELISAASRFTVDYIIQPFIPFPKEMGIFYVRYPDDKYGASCLISGLTQDKRPIHVHCSYPSCPLIKIITLYEPSPQRWNEDLTQRISS